MKLVKPLFHSPDDSARTTWSDHESGPEGQCQACHQLHNLFCTACCSLPSDTWSQTKVWKKQRSFPSV